MTLKYPSRLSTKKAPKAFKSRFEEEMLIPLKEAKEIVRGKESLLSLRSPLLKTLKKRVPLQTLARVRPLGSLTMKRSFVRWEKWVLEIDKCKTFSKRFYEVEVETSSPILADKGVRMLFKAYRIKYEPYKQSKLDRFVEEWKKESTINSVF